MERIFTKGLLTSLLGFSIIIFCCLCIYQSKNTPEEMAGWLSTGLLLLRANDTILGIKEKE